MLFRNLMLLIGAALVIGGLVFSLTWVNQTASPEDTSTQEASNQQRAAMVLVAAHPLPAGTLLRQGDLDWKELGATDMRPGFLLRNQIADTEFYGAIPRRDFAGGEPMIASDLVKPSDRYFLSAVLRPGTRAVSISVDAPQSASGLVLPGDRVDVILTQNLSNAATDPAHRTVAETVLRDVRVIAVDQSLSAQPKPAASPDQAKPNGLHLPRTVTLEVGEREAERLFVAGQLGGLQLSIRPLEGSAAIDGSGQGREPTWAVEVSPALSTTSQKTQQQRWPLGTGSTIESSVRWPPSKSLSNAAMSFSNDPREIRHD